MSKSIESKFWGYFYRIKVANEQRDILKVTRPKQQKPEKGKTQLTERKKKKVRSTLNESLRVLWNSKYRYNKKKNLKWLVFRERITYQEFVHVELKKSFNDENVMIIDTKSIWTRRNFVAFTDNRLFSVLIILAWCKPVLF
jgi:hypothetical protein